MRDPKIVLKQLSSFKKEQRVTDLYRYLCNPEFYKIAYQNIYSRPGQMTTASDGSTVDGMSMGRIEKLIQSIRNGTYRPTSLKRIGIPKKNGGTRTISIPSFNDKLVQEIIRMLLEALWEPIFLEYSHGFRPKRSCHTALLYTTLKFTGTKWWIDADIQRCFDSINHEILLKILKEKIREQKFIHLINLFLKNGYIENWKYDRTYSGTPQGSIISPILANIYLHKLDEFMEKIIADFEKGTRRHLSKEYNTLSSRVKATRQRIRNGIEIEKNTVRLKVQEKEERKYARIHGVCDNYDPDFKRLKYVRYADDFLIGVIGSRRDTENIKEKIDNFLRTTLKLNLHPEKTSIKHNQEKIRFLGYDLTVMKCDTRREINGKIGLWLPHDTMKSFIIDNRFGKFVRDAQTGKPKLKAIHRPELMNVTELEIVMQFNSKIRGLYNYYKMATNVSKMGNFNYIWAGSFFKTLAGKYRTKCSKLYSNRNYFQDRQMGVTYRGKFVRLWNGPFVVDKNIDYNEKIDIIENINKYFLGTSMTRRLEAKECELCHTDKGPFEIHHIRKLKDLNGKKNLEPWEKQMISRKRKTMTLCRNCHKKLHVNKL